MSISLSRCVYIYIYIYICIHIYIYRERERERERWNCPAWCSGGRRPLIAGCLSLQRLGIDFPVACPAMVT